MGRGWDVEQATGDAAAFHARLLPADGLRHVWRLDVDRPALVLGSAQPEEHVDAGAAAAAGVDVVRRRSGGGAVLLVPGRVLWIDVVIPRDDPLWDDDVGRAFHWLGAAWAEALRDLGVAAESWTGAMQRSPLSDRVCFAGLGPGEVTVDGRKVVGLSQRRTRDGARFQCAALADWDPGLLADLLRLDPADLDGVAAGVERPLDAVATALVRHLPVVV